MFATGDDIRRLLAEVERTRDLHYVRAGLSPSPVLRPVHSHRDIEGLGIAEYGDQSLEARYLVAERSRGFSAKEVRQQRGGTLYAVDQLLNPFSVVIRGGGQYDAHHMISGQLGTASEDPASLDLYDVIRAIVRRHFSKVKSYYVGQHAYELLKSGVRLTTSVRAPSVYDLRL